MTALTPAEALVHRLWALYQARRWAEAQALLGEQAVCDWPVTLERYVGAAEVVHVNAVYPEGWSIHLLELNTLADGRVHALVRVDQGEATFYANGFYRLSGDRIAELSEFWSDVQPAPAWRRDPSAPLPGQQRLPRDERQGLDLTLD